MHLFHLNRQRRRLRLWAILLSTATALALFVALSSGSSSASVRHATGSKPTIVLVHGAWADASSWSGVITRLQAAGYKVIAPADPLRSLRGDSAYISGVLAQTPGPLVVVGHSYGGAVITNAAAGNARVKALVYDDAFIPDVGENVLSLSGKGSEIPTALVPAKYPPFHKNDVELYINPSKFRAVFAAEVPAAKAAEMAASQRPLALAAGMQPTYATAWKTIPSWALIGMQDKVITPAEQMFMATRAHATIKKINSSHVSLVSHPGAVTKLIEEAATATS